MATNSSFRPKQWTLTENEDITSYQKWQFSMLYQLSTCNEYAPFLDSQWEKQGIAHRGLTNDPESVAAADRKTAAQKVATLETMLGLITQYAPSLLRNDIIKRSTSLSSIWQRIRKHYGFIQSEVHFLALSKIKRVQDERYETLFQRIIAHLEDNLLTVASNLQHDGAAITEDEVMSPTTERLAVYYWMEKIDERLPAYVARVYAHELQTKTLKDIQPQLSQSMDSLLAELNTQSDIQLHYTKSSYRPSRKNQKSESFNKGISPQTRKPASLNQSKVCSLCKAAGRPHQGHDIGTCWYLSKFEKLEICKTLCVTLSDEDDVTTEEANLPVSEANRVVSSEVLCNEGCNNTESIARMQVRKVACDISPFFYAFVGHHPVHVIVDSGATSSVVSSSFIQRIGIDAKETEHSARSADKSKLDVSGEIDHLILTFGMLQLPLCTAIVMTKLDCDILAGIPFCKKNDVHVHMKSEKITIGSITIPYGGGQSLHPDLHPDCMILRNKTSQVVMPGEFVEIDNNELSKFNGEVAIEPRADFPLSEVWPSPQISRVIQGRLRIPNSSTQPVKLARSQQIGQIRRVVSPNMSAKAGSEMSSTCLTTTKVNVLISSTEYSSKVILDPQGPLNSDERTAISDVNRNFDSSFRPELGDYNDRSGFFRARLNIGPVEPPPAKGRLPLYGQNDFQTLQDVADEMEDIGVLGKPEDHGVVVKHVSPSFLRRKTDGSYRLVTAFNNLSPYVRIPPTANISCDDTLRRLSSFKLLIKTDLTKSFYQMRLSKDSLPYLGTVTPFKGIRIYLRCPMGMPGSTEYLQELMSRIFGDYMQEGFLIVNADDMFIGGDTFLEIISNWFRVLLRLRHNNITISPSKTVICPKKTSILGWIWSEGKLSPNSHRIAALSSVKPPATCTAMRSFIGGYKALSRCIPQYSSLLSPLEDATKGLQGNQQIVWTPVLTKHFTEAQTALKSPTTITIPKPTDQLILTTDASPLNNGLGATLFVRRNEKQLISGFFSFKLKTHQRGWYPCEHEALAIATAVDHFAPYARESNQPMQVLTDSKPCYQAYQRLCSGQFSASARVSTFLSTLSSHKVTMLHIPGKSNVSSDYSSRHPRECDEKSCQVCSFVNETASSVVVSSVTVSDVLSGSSPMPYKNTAAWISAQHDCPDLRRAYGLLTTGNRPSRKSRNLRNLRRYLNVASVNKQGLIVVLKADPYIGIRNLIVVPSAILLGLVTALHLRFGHASKCQVTKLFSRHFFAIKSSDAINHVVDNCEQCNSVKTLPRELLEQRSTHSPSSPGEVFFADVLKRKGQIILATREVYSSFTSAAILKGEDGDILRDGLLLTLSNLRAPSCTVRVDNAPGFVTLKEDNILGSHSISLDYGRTKNKNKNSVIDKGIQELELEFLKSDPQGGQLSAVQLQLAVERLNSRIRNRGLSSREILYQRDQDTNAQLNLDDSIMAKQQRDIREQNHPHSANSKAKGRPSATIPNLRVGDLVFLKSDGDKNKARERYIVVKLEEGYVFVQKLSDKFMTRQYKLPLTEVYHATKMTNQTRFHDWDFKQTSHDSDTDSDMDSCTDLQDQEDNVQEVEPLDSQEDTLENTVQPPANNETTGRPQRRRQAPAWARSGDFDLS